MEPQDAEAAFRRAAEAYAAGDPATAMALCRELLTVAPEHPSVRQLAGMAALRQGAAAEAAEHLSVAARGLPRDVGVQLNLGTALRAAGQLAAALAANDRAIELAPQHPGAWFNRANLLLQLEREGEARAAFMQTLALQPAHSAAAFNLGLMLLSAEPEAAAGYLRQAIAQGPPSAVAQARLGAALRQTGDLTGAAEALTQAVALDPADVEGLALLAAVKGEQEAWGEAVTHYRAALELAPERADIASNLAWTLGESGALEEALAMARRAVAGDPALPAAHYHLGLIEQRRGDLAAAVAAMRATIALAPRHVRAHATLALLLEALGETEEAAGIAAPERQITRLSLAELDPTVDMAALNAELADWIYRHPTLLFDRPNRATTGGAQTLDLAQEEAPALARLRGLLERAIAADMAARAKQPKLAYFALPPADWTLSIWAVVLSSGGYQAPHNHPSGFVSGVYYVRVPDSIGAGAEAGYIEFGLSNVKDAEGRERASRFRLTAQPREGEALLFPSYLWHRTLPFTGAEDRISIAFDVLWR